MAILVRNTYLLCHLLLPFYNMFVSGRPTPGVYISDTISYILRLLSVGCNQRSMPGMQQTTTGMVALDI
jgi:hypothetical protein